MIYTDDALRPKPSYPIYPPYHKGDYLEDYFYTRFLKEYPVINRDYIGVSWTTLYVENKANELQYFLDALDPNGKYFTVLQHDDAPLHKLPEDTILFSAGGNYSSDKVVPIPLICSPLNISYNEIERDILAGFVGSNTHPIRVKMVNSIGQRNDCMRYLKGWSPSVNTDEFNLFINVALRSKYFLCPRGYGLNSFRIYESMQLGCVPVIITDKPYLPWADELNWENFSVLILENEIENLYNTLKDIPESRYQELRNNCKKLYKDYFSLDGVFNNIIKRLTRFFNYS